MSDENTPEATEPQATESTKPNEPATVPVTVVQDLRAKSRKLEEELTALREAEAERAKAELSEVERLKLELDEAKASATKAAQQAALEAKRSKARLVLSEARAHSPEKVLRLLDLDNLNEDAIGEAVGALRESDGYLFRTDEAPAPGSVGAPTESGSSEAEASGPDQDLLWLKQTGLI